MNDDTDDIEIRARLVKIFATVCKTRKRHDAILTDAVREALRADPHDPLPAFARNLARKLKSDETVIIGWPVLNALHERHNTKPFQRLQRYFKTGYPARASQPVVIHGTEEPVYLVVAERDFHVSEVTRDIWRALNPHATSEEHARNDYVVGCMRVADNIGLMGHVYSITDVVDCLHLIPENGAFFLRGLLLLHASIEPKPFIDKIETLGFHVTVILNEEETDEEFEDYDFLKRFQGILVTKSESAMAAAAPHLDFLIDLCRLIPIPTADLTGTGQVH